MNEKPLEHSGEIEIDLQRLFRAVWHRIWIVILAVVIAAGAAFGITHFLITPEYQSSAMFYVNNNSLSVGDASFSISSSDIVASKNLVDSYIVILNTRETLNDVIDYAGVNRTYGTVKEMLEASSVNETEIFQVVVTSTDPQEAESIASAIAYILPKRISSIIEGTSAKIVDSAVVPVSPSSPSYPKNIMLGALLGFVLSVLVIVLREIFDITLRTEEDVTRVCKYPILASVPNMAAPSKGGYYYDSSGGKKKQKKQTRTKDENAFMGLEINFAAAESYKLLRTKLQFSFADENHCHVIGVSSALAGEGKSLTTVNLAYSLAELGKSVLLIDCDMRRPSLYKKLAIKKSPGLSNFLSGQSKLDELLQPCGVANTRISFNTIAAGSNPPNPIELLSSGRMQRMLHHLREVYDYIILDLPPVAEVSDAMVAAKLTDGMLLVARQNYGNHPALSAAVREFEFVNAKILGVVYNCAQEIGGSYSKKYYKKYYRHYNYGTRTRGVMPSAMNKVTDEATDE